MKKYSVAVCVCAVLFSVGIHGGGMREVFARAPGADERAAWATPEELWGQP